jgi:hypothetical protein
MDPETIAVREALRGLPTFHDIINSSPEKTRPLIDQVSTWAESRTMPGNAKNRVRMALGEAELAYAHAVAIYSGHDSFQRK